MPPKAEESWILEKGIPFQNEMWIRVRRKRIVVLEATKSESYQSRMLVIAFIVKVFRKVVPFLPDDE